MNEFLFLWRHQNWHKSHYFTNVTTNVDRWNVNPMIASSYIKSFLTERIIRIRNIEYLKSKEKKNRNKNCPWFHVWHFHVWKWADIKIDRLSSSSLSWHILPLNGLIWCLNLCINLCIYKSILILMTYSPTRADDKWSEIEWSYLNTRMLLKLLTHHSSMATATTKLLTCQSGFNQSIDN